MWIEDIGPDDVHTSRDELGFPVMTIDLPSPPQLTTAFQHDIQTISIADRLYDMLTYAEEAYQERLTFQGNAFSVSIDKNRVTIENDIIECDDKVEMSIAQYRVLLDVWSAQLAW